MPAYFSLKFELYKHPDAITDFCDTLIHSGAVFKSGYWGSENDSFDDIIIWNQKKLEEDFELGYSEDHSHDYKQMLFDYLDFSEVRLFIMNTRKEPTFSFHLIIPEGDLLDYTEEKGKKYSVQLKNEKMEQLKSFAKKMWAGTAALAIQTEWELSDDPPSADEIAKGIKPQTEPFCIINSSLLKKANHVCIINSSLFKKEPNLVYEYIERNGVLIEYLEKRNYRL